MTWPTRVTLRAVIDQLRHNYPPITELQQRVIWTKACSVFQPDYGRFPADQSLDPPALRRATTACARRTCSRATSRPEPLPCSPRPD